MSDVAAGYLLPLYCCSVSCTRLSTCLAGFFLALIDELPVIVLSNSADTSSTSGCQWHPLLLTNLTKYLNFKVKTQRAQS